MIGTPLHVIRMMSLCIRVHADTHTHTNTCIQTHMHTDTCIQTHTNTHTHTDTYIQTHKHTYNHTYTYNRTEDVTVMIARCLMYWTPSRHLYYYKHCNHYYKHCNHYYCRVTTTTAL